MPLLSKPHKPHPLVTIFNSGLLAAGRAAPYSRHSICQGVDDAIDSAKPERSGVLPVCTLPDTCTNMLTAGKLALQSAMKQPSQHAAGREQRHT